MWIVPGGGVEPEEESSTTAVREVLEEAGVVGKLGRCLGMFEVISNLSTSKIFIHPFFLCRITSINTGPKYSFLS